MISIATQESGKSNVGVAAIPQQLKGMLTATVKSPGHIPRSAGLSINKEERNYEL